MAALSQVHVARFPIERFREVLGDEYGVVEEGVERAQEIFAGHAIWHVNSTAAGGGVVELLQSLLAYARGAGVDSRWVVVEGGPEFFNITKRIHNNLHGDPGDGGDLGDWERSIYEETLADACMELAAAVRPGDIVFLHDPQTAGMVPSVRAAGARVVWRCHVGLDLPNDTAEQAWDFLRGYVEEADAYVFSRREFAWEGLDAAKTWIVPPSIDVFSPKNQDLDPEVVASILRVAGLLGGDRSARMPASFRRQDGTPARVDREAEIWQVAPVPPDARYVAQVSRWDRLKDPAGVLRWFASLCDDPAAHLVLAGPAVEAVSDDPEGAEVLAEIHDQARALPADVAARVHLACLPMDDREENAAIVNAVQQRAAIVIQKSIAEGFGLTVAEAMWKSRPVVASRVGGIQDQVVDGESGLLVDNPHDLNEFAECMSTLMGDGDLAWRMGAAARERVRDHFLGTRHLIQYLGLLSELL